MHIYLFTYLPIYLYICLYVDLSVYLTNYLSIYLTNYLSIDISIYLSIYVYLNIYLPQRRYHDSWFAHIGWLGHSDSPSRFYSPYPFLRWRCVSGRYWPARYTRVSALRGVSLVCVVLGGGRVFRGIDSSSMAFLKVPCAPKRFDSRVFNTQNDETLSQNSLRYLSKVNSLTLT